MTLSVVTLTAKFKKGPLDWGSNYGEVVFDFEETGQDNAQVIINQ